MDTGNKKETKKIASVLKAVEVLETIAASESGLGVTEISQKLDYGVSATYHLLNTLKSCSMISQDRRTKKYHIGFTLFRISGQAMNQNLLGSLAMSYLEKLMKKTLETCNLSILEGTDAVCVAQVEGQHLLRMISRPGASSPFHLTAGGKLLLALQPRDAWTPLINQVSFEKRTPRTILSVDHLLSELELTRSRGYGLDDEEREEGVICIAAPVFDCYGQPVAAMSISGAAYRIKHTIEETAQTIMEVALEFSSQLGYRPEQAR